jgi:hypothetical protein
MRSGPLLVSHSSRLITFRCYAAASLGSAQSPPVYARKLRCTRISRKNMANLARNWVSRNQLVTFGAKTFRAVYPRLW